MKVFAAGIATETNTFAPMPTGVEDFAIWRGNPTSDPLAESPSFDLPKLWGEPARARGAEFVFSLMACAQPSGITVKSVYESLRDEILRDLEAAMPVDIVLLMLHGAMVARDYDDCEEDIIRRVRNIVGPHAIVGIELDLHCHLSEAKIEAADIVITYKEYPHVDINDRARELFDLAFDAKLGRIRPVMALFDLHMIGSYPTSREPLRGFVASLKGAERRQGVLSISFAHGFRSADLPHVGAKMLVVSDGDRLLAKEVAREYGLRVYRMRRNISFDSVSLPLDVALSKGMKSAKLPCVVADQSDNPGGGAPGDATFALRWLLEQRAEGVGMAIMYDPQVVQIAKKIGAGATLPVRIGGKTSALSGDPVDVEITVASVLDNYTHLWPQQSGAPLSFPLGDVAALHCGGIDIVVSSRRCQCLNPAIFSDLGIDPRSKRLLVVKSNQHFYSAFSAIAGEVIYMAGPGAVPPDPRQIAYRRLDTGSLYPWVENPLGD